MKKIKRSDLFVFKAIKIFILLIFFGANQTMASHYMGGEITWQCLGNGKYRFIMKLYRECSGVSYGTTETISVSNYSGLNSITMNLYPGGNVNDINDGVLDGITELSPVCWDSSQRISCSHILTANSGAIQEWYYTSDFSFPQGVLLNGIPPPQGWIFSHTGCCRNPSINLIDPTNTYWVISAAIYQSQNNAFPCFDNSPYFINDPQFIF